MRIIKSYGDYLAALKDKESTDRVVRNEAKNALGLLRQKDPAIFDLFEQQKKKGDEILVTFGYDEEDVRKKAKERICTPKYKYMPFDADFPFGINSEDVLESINELPIDALLTKDGKLARRDVILKRCVYRIVILKKLDDSKLRHESVRLFCDYCSNGSIIIHKPLKKEDIVYYLNNEISVLDLLKLYPSNCAVPLPWKMAEFLNEKEIAILPQSHPFIVQSQMAANKAQAKAKQKAKKKALKAKKEGGEKARAEFVSNNFMEYNPTP